MPRTFLDDAMIVNAKPPRELECAIGDLIHAHRAGGRFENIKRVAGARERPTPISPRDRIARSFYLRKRRQQVSGDHRRGMETKNRTVLGPCFVGRFGKPVTGWKKQLGGLSHDLEGPIHGQPQGADGGDANDPLGGSIHFITF